MNENNDNIVPQEEEAGLQSAPEIQLENTETPSETMQTEKKRRRASPDNKGRQRAARKNPQTETGY